MNPVERAVMTGARVAVRRALRLQASPAVTGLVPPTDAPIGLYLHVPFCESLCPFCPFHRVHFDVSLAERYMAALRVQMQHYAALGFRFGSIYVGGGTPTVVAAALSELLLEARRLWPIGTIAVETNPNHLVPERLDPLRAAGVGRLSVGVQSFDDAMLRQVGRLQAYGSGADLQRRIGAVLGTFETVNVDMMFNLPGQTRASLATDLACLHGLQADQVSYYPLMAPGQVDAARQVQPHADALTRAEFATVGFEREREYYEQICAALLADGELASVWCFNRRPAAIDEYIVDEDHYVGLGSGAFSLLGNRFLASSFSIPRYVEQVAAGACGPVAGTAFSRTQVDHYRLLVKLFGLRWSRADVERLLGSHWRLRLTPLLQTLQTLGAIRVSDDAIKLTTRGRYLWLVMMREFLTGVNQVRQQLIHDHGNPGPGG